MQRRTPAWIHREGKSSILITVEDKYNNAWQQAIHPNQVQIIQSTFVPTAQGMHTCLAFTVVFNCSSEIERAAKIVHAMKLAHSSQKGAVGLDGFMIDAPMIKQVMGVILPWTL